MAKAKTKRPINSAHWRSFIAENVKNKELRDYLNWMDIEDIEDLFPEFMETHTATWAPLYYRLTKWLDKLENHAIFYTYRSFGESWLGEIRNKEELEEAMKYIGTDAIIIVPNRDEIFTPIKITEEQLEGFSYANNEDKILMAQGCANGGLRNIDHIGKYLRMPTDAVITIKNINLHGLVTDVEKEKFTEFLENCYKTK